MDAEQVDLDMVCDFVPITLYDPNVHVTTYACPVCNQLVHKNQSLKVWTHCEHLTHAQCFEEWLQ